MAQLYKKTGTCSRPDGAQTDYPMYLWVGESAGSVIGSELVTNGGFDSNTTGWSTYQCTIASVAGGQSGNCLQITDAASSGGSTVYRAVTPQYGKRYRLSGYAKSGTSGNESYTVYVCPRGGPYTPGISGTSSADWTYFSLEFEHSYSSGIIDLIIGKNTSTDGTMLFDSISLVEIPDVHCSGHCQTDFGDIRFHDAADAEPVSRRLGGSESGDV